MSYDPSGFNWANPQFENAGYHKWTAEGDTIEGVIVGMSTVTFPAKDDDPERTYPVLVLDTAAGEKELTISGVDLLAKTKAKAPQVGDWYSAAWVATAGKKRIFLVNVRREAEIAPAPRVPATVDERHAGLVAAQQDLAPF